MKEFMSLQDFMLLNDPTYTYKRRFFTDYKSGDEWIRFYNIAKASFEKYGSSPPEKCKVRTLCAGYGGPAGCIRKFGGEYKWDKRYFQIIEPTHKQVGLVLKEYWWARIKVIEQ